VEVRADVETLLAEHPVATTPDVELRGARFDAGLAFVHFPPGLGGRGLDRTVDALVEQAFLAAGAADWSERNVVGFGMAAPTLEAHGTPEQQALLRPLFTGEHVWCQLFSEPGSGSDLAGLATRAVRDGDTWVVTGQKVWSTLAHVARWGLLLARTDPGVPKHRGLGYFLLDMRSPGVEVRPLRQITGDAEFNEVFLDEVRIPAGHLVGAPGDGWRVAMTTLANERARLGGPARGAAPIDRLLDLVRAQGGLTGAHRDALLRAVQRAEVLRLANERWSQAAGREQGAEGALAKVAMARSNQEVFDLALTLLGPAGTLIDGYAPTRPDAATVHGPDDVRRAFLRTRANSIEGGTSEILRNVIAERLLGLPPDPRVDKDRPWSEVQR
ncbi:MAG TPA: acyl-CoA dehydrogenase family protein, partial [Acidimicrobiales bacterium]